MTLVVTTNGMVGVIGAVYLGVRAIQTRDALFDLGRKLHTTARKAARRATAQRTRRP